MTDSEEVTAAPPSEDAETLVLKLGGSVVTEKDAPETVDDGALAAAAAAVAEFEGALVLVHGGGSFGHPHAADHGVDTASGTRDAAGVLAIHEAMGRLNRAVVAALQDQSVPALPVRPLSAAARDETGDLDLSATAVSGLLDEGFVPVVHGDVVAHAGEGATVLSGDELVTELATAVGADRVGVCSTVPGVLDEEGAVIERIDAIGEVTDVLGESEATDVTGGMAGKVRSMLDLSAPVQLFGPDALSAFLRGDAPGTTVAGER